MFDKFGVRFSEKEVGEISLAQQQRCASELLKLAEEPSLFGQQTAIYQVNHWGWHCNEDYLFGGPRWYHLDRERGVFDYMWEEDPQKIEGPIIDGWHGTGGESPLYWRRQGVRFEVFTLSN